MCSRTMPWRRTHRDPVNNCVVREAIVLIQHFPTPGGCHANSRWQCWVSDVFVYCAGNDVEYRYDFMHERVFALRDLPRRDEKNLYTKGMSDKQISKGNKLPQGMGKASPASPILTLSTENA